jgi:hypothetical protein
VQSELLHHDYPGGTLDDDSPNRGIELRSPDQR